LPRVLKFGLNDRVARLASSATTIDLLHVELSATRAACLAQPGAGGVVVASPPVTDLSGWRS